MIARRKLPALNCSFKRRIERLKARCPSSPKVVTADIEAAMAFVTIEAQTSWSNFCRSYYLSCIFQCKPNTSDRVSTDYGRISENDAIGIAIKTWKPSSVQKADGTWHRRDEPPWHDTNVLLTLATNMKASNLLEIQSALSAGFRVFVDLPVFRNFYAHRNHRSLEAASKVASIYGIPSGLRPTQVLLTFAYKRPQVLMQDWLDDLCFTVEYLCE
jgi:hypothetical protein